MSALNALDHKNFLLRMWPILLLFLFIVNVSCINVPNRKVEKKGNVIPPKSDPVHEMIRNSVLPRNRHDLNEELERKKAIEKKNLREGIYGVFKKLSEKGHHVNEKHRKKSKISLEKHDHEFHFKETDKTARPSVPLVQMKKLFLSADTQRTMGKSMEERAKERKEEMLANLKKKLPQSRRMQLAMRDQQAQQALRKKREKELFDAVATSKRNDEKRKKEQYISVQKRLKERKEQNRK